MRKRSGTERWTAYFAPPSADRATLLLSRERFTVAQSLVSAYYGVLFFLAAGNIYNWQGYLGGGALTPRWPVFWLRYVDAETGIGLILGCHLIGGMLAVTLARFRLARTLVFVSHLVFLGFKFSFGSINHGDHLGILISFVLIFLPAGWNARGAVGRDVRAATLRVFAGCQALIMLTYSMSGLWKAGGVIEQWIKGEWITYLHPRGLAQQVAGKLLEDDGSSLLGPWLIEHAWLGWLPGIAALYLELFALWVVARPSLHRVWGLALAFFHIATHLVLGVGFFQHTLWLTLFFVLSPFAPYRPDVRRTLGDLPVIGRWLPRVDER